MARVKIEEIVDSLRSEMTKALEDAVRHVLPDAQVSRTQLFRAFKRAVGRKCSTWERIPNQYVEVDE